MTYFWLFLAISGYIWLFLAISGYFWPFMAIFGYIWLFLAISRYLWLFLAISDYSDNVLLFLAILFFFLAIFTTNILATYYVTYSSVLRYQRLRI